jgi:predicted nucleic acid-binding OB-fold protein
MSTYNPYSQNSESTKLPGYQLDTTLIKIFLNSVKEGDLQEIKNNIEKYSFDVKVIKDSQYEQNALFYAALIKDDITALNVMKFFVEQGLNPLHTDKIRQTALYYAAREGKFLCCKFLIEQGCPLNDKDLYHQTPVYYACREGKISIVELMVNNGSDINLDDKYGQTCIFYAIREGHLEVVEFLIKRGADINKTDKKKMTPYLFANKFGKIKIAELLLNYGAQTHAKLPELPLGKGKNKAKKQRIEEVDSKIESEDLGQKSKKYILVRVNENGEKSGLTADEIEEFKNTFPDVFNLMNNANALAELEKHAPEELKHHDSWEKQAKKLMNSLWKFKESELFHKPVDPIELGIPDYFDIIKHPMDFSTIKKKLNNFQYTKFKEFCDDMDLVFNNCILYNGVS